MKIRKFERADLPQVLELCREVRQYHTDILGGYFAEQDDAFEQSGFLATLEDDRMTALVAEEGEEINGYLLAEKKYSPYLREPNVVHISNIGVKKGLRGKGIGKKLMDALLRCVKQKVLMKSGLEYLIKILLLTNFMNDMDLNPLNRE